MHRFKKIVLSICAFLTLFVFAIYLTIWGLSPFVAHHYTNKALAEHNITLSEETSIRYNPFSSNILVKKLSFIKHEKTVLRLEKAELEIDLYKLFFDIVYIKTFSINSADINIEINDNEREIAGIKIPVTDAASEPAQSKQEQQPLPFIIEAPNLIFDEIGFNVTLNDNLQKFKLVHLDISQSKISQDAQSLNIALKARVADGDIQIQSSVNFSEKSGNISSKLSLDNIDLQDFQSQLGSSVDQLKGKISFDIRPEIHISESNVALSTTHAVLTLSNVTTQKNDYVINIGKHILELDKLDLLLENNVVNSLSISGKTAINQFNVNSAATQDILTQWDSLALSAIDIGFDGQPSPESLVAAIEKIELDNFVGSHKSSEKQQVPALATLGNMTIDDLNFSANTLSIDKISISAINSNILLNPDKSVATLTDFSTQDTATAPQDQNITSAKEESTTTNKDALHMQINEVNLLGENKVHFIDRSVQPIYERTLYIDKFNISAIDNHKVDLSPFHFSGRSNEYAKINLDGGVALFSDLVNVKLKGEISELSLPPVSSYVKQALGFELKSGQLDTAVDIKINESQLAGNIGLFARGLDMSAAEKDPDPSVLREQTAIPLNVALGMLKDKKGNIKLDIPMSGSVDDPSFGLSSFLLLVTKKAAISQAKSYLMQTFVPYASVVSVAISAGEFAMKLRFQDLPFPTAATDIDETQHQYMEQFITLMKDKPKTQVKICGVATAEDINLAAGTKVTNPEEIDRLRAIAKKRGESFKEYSVKVGGLKSSRMLLCKPRVTFGKKALPRVEIKI